MSDQKKELIDLIEAYTTSKMTQNETLLQFKVIFYKIIFC